MRLNFDIDYSNQRHIVIHKCFYYLKRIGNNDLDGHLQSAAIYKHT